MNPRKADKARRDRFIYLDDYHNDEAEGEGDLQMRGDDAEAADAAHAAEKEEHGSPHGLGQSHY